MNPSTPQPEPSNPIQLSIELKTPDSDLVLMRLHPETDPKEQAYSITTMRSIALAANRILNLSLV